MKRHILITLLLTGICLAFCTPTSLTQNLEIVGGEDGDIKDFPYQVSFRYSSSHYCGGSLIAPSFVLTAAHCIVEDWIGSMSVLAGSTNRRGNGQIAKVAKVHLHPQYNSSKDLDCAILELDRSFSLSSTVDTVDLPPVGVEPIDGTMCSVTGWGYVAEDIVGFPEILQKVYVPIIDRSECRTYFKTKISDNRICAGYREGGKDACLGDSGGPLVCNGIQVGIVSAGKGCAQKNKPGVYTKVANIRHFIQKIARV